MSARALNWAWAARPRTATQKLVLAALADRADDDGICWPSAKWLASKCAPISVRSVRRAIDELEEQGLIKKAYRNRKENGQLSTWIYLLPISTSGHERPVAEVEPVATGGHTEPSSKPSRETYVSLGEPPKPRNRDPVWDALVEVFGEAPLGMERGRWNKAAKSLRAEGATQEQVLEIADVYRRRWPEVDMTPTALAANWTTLNRARDGPRQRITGWRMVRGTHGSTFIEDPEGTDTPPKGYT